MENMAIFYRFRHLAFSEYLCSKTNTEPVCNRKAATQALPHWVFKKFREEKIFSVISVSQGGEHHGLSKEQSVRARTRGQWEEMQDSVS